jgi:GxxExxY protein
LHNLKYIYRLTGKIIGISYKVHWMLGPGLPESSYKACLAYELEAANLFVEKEKPLPLIHKDTTLDIGHRLDLMVEQTVVVEIKSVEALTNVHTDQVLTYLKLTQKKAGLLINFNVQNLKKGIKRLILKNLKSTMSA